MSEPALAGSREPTASLPLRWGRYRSRYLGGLVLVVSGTVGLQGATPHFLFLLLAGTAAHAVGWSVLPATGWRRLVVVVPSVAVVWLLLTGPQASWTLAVPFVAWLLVRRRPLKSYVTVLFVIAAGVLIPQFLTEYSSMPLALGIMAVVLVASAWVARLIALGASPSQRFRGNRPLN